jgi:hypothetical protein
LFETSAAYAVGTPDEDTETVADEEYHRRKSGRRKPPYVLPRVRIEHDLLDAHKQCPCGACLQRIGEQTSEQYDVIPPVFSVPEHVRFKYACPACDDHSVTTAPKQMTDRRGQEGVVGSPQLTRRACQCRLVLDRRDRQGQRLRETLIYSRFHEKIQLTGSQQDTLS